VANHLGRDTFNILEAEAGAAAGSRMTTRPNGHVCLWCGKGFTPRCDGGKRQVFCRPTCRRAFDAAGRRWVSEAIASGMLSVDALRNGPGATRALFAGVISPGRVDEPRKPIPPTPAERPGEAEELLSDFLIALFALPDGWWFDFTGRLPDELFGRLALFLKKSLGVALAHGMKPAS
jgi:hypothetical protein